MAKTYYCEDTDCIISDALYFVLDDVSKAIKIGRGGNPRQRLSGIQTGNPNDLVLLAEVPNKGWQEAFWHCAFIAWLKRGEWFEDNEPLRLAIAALVAGEDWTDHVPVLMIFDDDREVDPVEWQEHMLDALEAYEETVLLPNTPLNARTAAAAGIFDPDFDGRCLTTRHAELLNRVYGEAA